MSIPTPKHCSVICTVSFVIFIIFSFHLDRKPRTLVIRDKDNTPDAQTKGRQTPAPTVNRDPQALVAVMIDTSPVIVEVAPELPHPQMGAFYDNEKQTLFVKKDIGDSVALCQCVAQELGHAQLSIDSDSYSRKDMGFQAMCVGYMLCKKYGVDTKNFAINRIPEEWKNKEPKEIRAELSKTRTAMNEIHSRVSEEMYRQKQERSKDRDSR